jgi:transposase
MPRGQQQRVRSPGVNRKQTVFGAFCYGRGAFFYHVQPRKNAWGVQALLQKLVHRARRTGRRIVVVMDQGSPHHAKALTRYVEDVKEHLEVFWLPHYSHELNLIERLWKHLKASHMAKRTVPQFRGVHATHQCRPDSFCSASGLHAVGSHANITDDKAKKHTRSYLVDDGVATGATMRASIWAARAEGTAELVIAVPVCAPEAMRMLRDEADEVVCLLVPEYLYAISQFFVDFRQVDDAEVMAILAAHGEKQSSHAI